MFVFMELLKEEAALKGLAEYFDTTAEIEPIKPIAKSRQIFGEG